MHIVVVGINHETAPIDVRELLSFSEEEIKEFVVDLMRDAELYEAVILSTCNRLELYGTALSMHAFDRIESFVSAQKKYDLFALKSLTYRLHNLDTIRHIFRVASGLDSLVMGEPQILGQVRNAYEIAHGAKTTAARLSKLFQSALELGKVVRNTTSLGSTPTSIATISIQLAQRLLGDLNDARVLVVGAGEICETAAALVAERQPQSIVIVNRTFEKAQKLAEKVNGLAQSWHNLGEAVRHADLILTGTSSPAPIISQQMLSEAAEEDREKRLVVLDIGSPRDVEPSLDCQQNIFLYDIDALKLIAEENRQQRVAEIPYVEGLIDQACERYVSWLDTLEVVPTIVDLREKFESIREAEIRQHIGKISDIDERGIQRIEQMTQAIVNKILHEPQVRLKQRATDKTGKYLAESIRYLFALDEERKGE